MSNLWICFLSGLIMGTLSGIIIICLFQVNKERRWKNKMGNLVDLNDLAVEVTEAEGGKVSTNIAQVKEVMRILLTKMAEMSVEQVEDILAKYKSERPE